MNVSFPDHVAKYEATSLDDIATLFDHYAECAKRNNFSKAKRAIAAAQRESDTWTKAAAILRATTLTAME